MRASNRSFVRRLDRSKKVLAAVSVAAASVALTVSPVVATAMPTSTGKGGGALASGRVLDALGRPDPHAVVFAYAWPDQSALVGQKSGAKIPLIPLGKAKVDAAGLYTVHVPPGQLMKAAGKPGYVNVELAVVSGGQDMTYDYSVRPFAKGSPNVTDSWTVMGASEAAPAPRVDYDFKAHMVSRTPESGHASGLARESALVGSPSASLAGAADVANGTRTATSAMTNVSASPDSVPYCSLVAGTITPNNKEHFSTLYTMSGIPATLTEGTSSTHTMGVAVSVDRTSWSASGSTSITHTSSVKASATYSTSHTMYNRVNYRDYSNSCTGRTARTPYNFYDILSDDGVNVARANWYTCDHKSTGSTWSTGTATEITVSNGVSLSVASLSAQSGFSDNVDLSFKYNVPGEICGNSSFGPAQSSIVEADIY